MYDSIPADLTSLGGPALGWISDSLFQEIDIETGELIFEWRASHHYPVNNTFYDVVGQGGDRESAFDYFHFNGVDKDDEGNYLICSRHLHSVSSIDGGTGEVLWTLGGKLNEFNDLSNGAATSFAWQHDARWHDNNTLTLFDNSVHSYNDPQVPSRGIILDLDVSRTATVRNEYYHPLGVNAVSQGDVQILPNDNVFVGWGHSAAFTEFDSDGTPLCNANFAAYAFFNFGRVVSYRIKRGDWVSEPVTAPDAAVLDDRVYVSWNGATEVATWRFDVWDGRNLTDMTFQPRSKFEKDGFETEIEIPAKIGSTLFRLAALDSQGEELGITAALQRSGNDSHTPYYWGVIILCVLFGCCLLPGCYFSAGWRPSRWRRRLREYQLLRDCSRARQTSRDQPLFLRDREMRKTRLTSHDMYYINNSWIRLVFHIHN